MAVTRLWVGGPMAAYTALGTPSDVLDICDTTVTTLMPTRTTRSLMPTRTAERYCETEA